MRLNKLEPGKQSTVKKIFGSKMKIRRLLDLGFAEGTTVRALYKSPSGDPVAYFVRKTVIALRAEDAENIEVEENAE